MAQHKRGLARTQTALLPATIEDYVGRTALVRVIDAYVSGLDIRALGFKYSVVLDNGRPPYAPDDLLRLYLYGYWNGIRSSRKLEAECQRNLELIWLLGQLTFDHKTIANFRRDNAQPFKQACAQFVQLLREAQLVGGPSPVVAIDGSKFKACAAKASMADADRVSQRRAQTQARIDEYLKQLAQADQAEPQAHHDRLSPQQIQAALERLKKRDQALQAAQAQLTPAAQTPALERPLTDAPGQTPTAVPEQTPATASASTSASASASTSPAPAPESLPAPAPKRVNLTDPDSVMLTTKEGATQVGYNVMQAVDSQHKLIVAHEVTTQRNDHASLQPMALAAQQALQVPALTAVCDTGFMNGEQSDACEALGITPVVPMARPSNTRNAQLYAKALFRYDSALGAYHCPANQILTRYKRDKTAKTDYYTTRACESCALKSKCTESKQRSIARSWFADAAERAHQRAQERTLMKLRSATVEHPFGNLKAMMPGGFLMRTLPKVQGEMALAVLTYNIKRVLSILGFAQLMEKLAAMQQLQPV